MFGRRYAAVAAAAVFTLVGAGCAEVTSGTPGVTLSVAGVVQAGAKATLSQKSAHFTIKGTFAEADQNISVTGAGDMDFAAHAMKMSMHMKIAGQSATITEILAGGAIYMSIDAGGQTMKDLIGKDWGKISIPGGVSTNSTGSNPLEMLKYMSDAGATVTPLGDGSIRGVVSKGYTVTIPGSVLAKAATKALNADSSISADERAAALQALQNMDPVVMDVWFDPAKNLLQRMRVKMSLALGGSGGFSGDMTFDFTQYGGHVAITAPPANDVAPFVTH